MKFFFFSGLAMLLLSGCGQTESKANKAETSDSLMDSVELKKRAETTEKNIMHIGDSIEQMQRQAEAEAAN